MKYQDYYETLGVPRTATADEIQKAYRALARKFHPDVNKEAGAENRFKQVGEAYEVLKDPETRARYDALGANWRNGQDFKPPPGYEQFNFGGRDSAGFSDFFESLFSARGGAASGGQGFDFSELFGNAGGRQFSSQGSSGREAEVWISVDEAFRGTKRTLAVESVEPDQGGALRKVTKKIEVNIPLGSTEGTRIRLSGKSRGEDIYVTIRLQPHPQFKVDGHDLLQRIQITPWEAALGAKVEVPTVDGSVKVSVPPGAQSGQKLRLKGKGLPGIRRGSTSAEPGDLFVELQLAIPQTLNDEERKLFEQLAKVSKFRPRGG